MTIAVDLEQRLGDFRLAARFESEGRVTALFGRSGSGKTSLVNLVAGLTRPDRGRIVVDGRVLVDTAAGVFLPMHRRRIGYVFQEGRLFPHLSVGQNLGYGRWFAPAAGRYQSFDDVVDLLGLGRLVDRRPEGLSGGEKQRVAIGRALLASPRLLLMDEPLAALDDARKAEVLPFIERLRDETRIPIVYVSHSVAEIARLASAVVVLADGRVVAEGPTDEVMRRLDLFPLVAEAEAGSTIDTTVEAHDGRYGLTRLASRAGPLEVPRLHLGLGHPVRVRVRARDVMIATARPEGLSALNVLEATVVAIRPDARAGADVALDCNGVPLIARLTRRSVDALGLAPGHRVFAVVKSVAFDRGTVALNDS